MEIQPFQFGCGNPRAFIEFSFETVVFPYKKKRHQITTLTAIPVVSLCQQRNRRHRHLQHSCKLFAKQSHQPNRVLFYSEQLSSVVVFVAGYICYVHVQALVAWRGGKHSYAVTSIWFLIYEIEETCSIFDASLTSFKIRFYIRITSGYHGILHFFFFSVDVLYHGMDRMQLKLFTIWHTNGIGIIKQYADDRRRATWHLW